MTASSHHLASLLCKMADHNFQKAFRLCLTQEQLEFQEALAQVVGTLVHKTI